MGKESTWTPENQNSMASCVHVLAGHRHLGTGIWVQAWSCDPRVPRAVGLMKHAQEGIVWEEKSFLFLFFKFVNET